MSDSITALPPWADAELSKRLPELAAAGERQDTELKERFPAQARDLAKEIAAFASSNAGVVLLGISDDGEVVGLPDCHSPMGRTQLIGRIEGICANIVKPAVTPGFRFGLFTDRPVLAIEVPKGTAPLYYVDNIAYIRQLTASRPAEPHEVIDRVVAWHRARSPDAELNPETAFLSEVAPLLVDILVYANELDERNVNPWFDILRQTLADLARRTRELSVVAPDDLSDIVTPLQKLATTLDKAAHERLAIGMGWDEMRAAASSAISQAECIKRDWIDVHKIDESSLAQFKTMLKTTSRNLTGLASRLEEMDEQYRLDEIQSEAGEYGLILLKIATFGVGLGEPTRLAELTTIGRLLRDVETRTLYADGGQSVERIFDDVRGASTRLNEWLAE